MVTAIVSTVHHVLFSGKSKGAIVNIAMEIILLVSPDSILRTSDGSNTDEVTSIGKLDIVPGPSSGEGCSIHGGCASCPYMKTRLTISKGGDGTDDCNGDVLVVPDMIRYKTKSPGQGRAEQSRAERRSLGVCHKLQACCVGVGDYTNTSFADRQDMLLPK